LYEDVEERKAVLKKAVPKTLEKVGLEVMKKLLEHY